MTLAHRGWSSALERADGGEPERGGRLIVVATPIGNMEDITFRAVRTLGEVDALACEDTRRTRKILQRYEIRRPPVVISYREHNEQRAGARILRLLEEGRSVALCSDAGYPGVSDPGYRIVSEALDRGYRVEVLPGAGAVTAALVASGLPTSSYTFKGFPPRKRGRRLRFLEAEAAGGHTLVFFESPRRAAALLEEAQEALGDRMAAVCIDLTKRFERVERGRLSELSERLRGAEIKGEVTVVIAGDKGSASVPNAGELPVGRH